MSDVISLKPASSMTPGLAAPCPLAGGGRTIPVLTLEAADGREFAAGWYALSGHVETTADPIALSVCAGTGAAAIDVGLVPLLPCGNVDRNAVYRLPVATRVLSLVEVSGRAGLPISTELGIRVIDRRQALKAMLDAFRDADGRREWRALCACLWSAGVGFLSSGGAAAAGRVLRCYRTHLRTRQSLLTTLLPDMVPIRIRRRASLAWTSNAEMLVAGQVCAVLEGEGHAWAATGDDPKFVVPTHAIGRPLPSGWYRFRARIQVLAGFVVGPCLYPDYGQGNGESSLIPLGEPDAEGVMDLLVVLRQPTHGLRFDPTMRQARFHLEGVCLERQSRLGAFAYMLSRLPGQHGRGPWRERVTAFGRFLRELPRKGLSGATAELFRRYQDSTIRSQVSYDSWVERYDSFSALEIKALRQRAAAIVGGPRFSILVPVFQTPEHWLRKCIESVLAQAYPHWELCLADDASPAPHVRKVLDEYASRDARIKVMHRSHNGHISAASNSALELATGDYIGLLDHDDELRPHALLEVAEALQEKPNLKVIYSDEDKVDEQGRRFDPYFKPDWNPELLRSQNYLCHFSVVEAGLLRSVGGFREGFEGSQDHDLLLRCTERAGPGEVHHIPRVLYHWRAIAGSTALVRDAKDYAADAGARAVTEHLARIGAGASLEQLPHGHYRVRWSLGDKPPKVSLIIPTRDRLQLVRKCVESLLERTDYPNFELLVVDNQSREPETLAYLGHLESSGRARVLSYDAPFNFSAINNWAVSRCDGELIGLLNNDIEVISPDWLREMAGQARRPEIGAVGAMLYYPDERIQHAGVILGIGGVANHAYVGKPRGYPGHGGRAKVAQGVSAVTAACLVVRREAYERVGGLDETLQVAFNDVDFCLRLRAAGLQNLWTPFAEFYHHESASRGSEDTPEKAARFRGEVERMEARWGEQLYWDPAYNPNLTLFGTDFGYAFPPRVGQAPIMPT